MPLLVQAACLDQPLFLRSTERRRGRFARLLCDTIFSFLIFFISLVKKNFFRNSFSIKLFTIL